MRSCGQLRDSRYAFMHRRYAGDMVDEKIADDRLGHRREAAEPESCRSCTISTRTPAGVSLKVQTTQHAFGQGFQVMKSHLKFFAIDNLFGCPGNGNPGAGRGHDDNIAIDAALKIPDVAIVWQNFWPDSPDLPRSRKFRHLMPA